MARDGSTRPSIIPFVHSVAHMVQRRHLKNNSQFRLSGESSKESFACANDNIHSLQEEGSTLARNRNAETEKGGVLFCLFAMIRRDWISEKSQTRQSMVGNLSLHAENNYVVCGVSEGV